MRAKGSEENVLDWLYERGEEAVGQAVQELFGRRGVTDGVSKLVERAAKTKGRVDRNMEFMLHLMNLPSRADYHKLLVKLEHLQGSLINLNMKLDRLLAAQARPPAPRKRRVKPDTGA